MDTSIACHPKSYQISSPRQCQYYHLPNVSTDLFDMPNMWHVVLTSRCQSWGEDHSFLEREHHRKQQKQTRYGVHILCKYKQRRLCVTPAPQYTRKNPYIYIYIHIQRERERDMTHFFRWNGTCRGPNEDMYCNQGFHDHTPWNHQRFTQNKYNYQIPYTNWCYVRDYEFPSKLCSNHYGF